MCETWTGHSHGGRYPKAAIVRTVMEDLRKQGSFSAKSVEQFWRPFKTYLCFLCQAKFDSLDTGLKDAVKMLQEAVKLDSGNSQAKQNLAAIKKAL